MRKSRMLLMVFMTASLALLAFGCDQAAIDSFYGTPSPQATTTSSTPSPEPTATSTPEPAPTPTGTPSAPPAPEPTPDVTPEPAVDPALMTMSLRAIISDIAFHQPPEDAAPDIFYLSEDVPDQAQAAQVHAIVTEETLVVDSQTGERLRADSLEAGDTVMATCSILQDPSDPQGTRCLALMTNLGTDTAVQPAYVRPISVVPQEDGSLRVRNQNADLDVIIPADLQIEAFGEPQLTLPAADITVGTPLLVWLDAVVEGAPAEAPATRVLLARSATSDAGTPPETSPETPGEPATPSEPDAQDAPGATPVTEDVQPVEPAPDNPQPIEHAPVPISRIATIRSTKSLA